MLSFIAAIQDVIPLLNLSPLPSTLVRSLSLSPSRSLSFSPYLLQWDRIDIVDPNITLAQLITKVEEDFGKPPPCILIPCVILNILCLFHVMKCRIHYLSRSIFSLCPWLFCSAYFGCCWAYHFCIQQYL